MIWVLQILAFVVVGSIPTLCILVILPESTCHIGWSEGTPSNRAPGRSGSAALQGHPDERTGRWGSHGVVIFPVPYRFPIFRIPCWWDDI